MSVFVIKQVAKEAPAPKVTVEPATTDVDAAMGDTVTLPPGPDGGSGDDTAPAGTLKTSEGTPVPVSGKGKDMKVKIDGPVGRVFTEALNRILAQESYMTMLPAVMKTDAPVKDPVEEDDPALQVYCWTGDALNTQDVVDITDDIVKHSNRDFVIAVENARPTRTMGILDGLSALPNVRIYYNRDAALNAVKSRIEA